VPPVKKPPRPTQFSNPVKLFARPHEIFITRTPDGHEYVKAMVTHLNPAGPLVKIEMEHLNGEGLTAEVPKEVIDKLSLKKGEYVYVRPKNTRVFNNEYSML
jgi:sulfate transport system ATP-binding protein